MSAAEHEREASRVEQAVEVNEQTDKRVARYLRLGSWLSWTIVRGRVLLTRVVFSIVRTLKRLLYLQSI